MLAEIEENTLQNHSEHLEKQAALLSTMLTKMDIRHIISITDTEPDFLEWFSGLLPTLIRVVGSNDTFSLVDWFAVSSSKRTMT